MNLSPSTMDNETAVAYLSSLINRTLHVHITDHRLFVGQLKCTDKDRNIILQGSHEYRQPSKNVLKEAYASANNETVNPAATMQIDMSSRYVGLIVVPGQYITKVEVEEVG